MLRLPYGISNFETLVREGYHFVDRTPFLARLEALNERYLFFLRPRRFGKSLFVSMLQCYYGVEYAEQFEELFGNFAIGQEPTKLANAYLVLKLDFSRINTQTSETTFISFFDNVRDGVSKFLDVYADYFADGDDAYILGAQDATATMIRLFERFYGAQIQTEYKRKIYLLVDEYDHFANQLIAFRLEDFKETVSRTGYVRKFYESIKTATGDGIVDRIFVTGVAPLTLDSMTSGFNIGAIISGTTVFHQMMGFTENEVQEILAGSGFSTTDLTTVQDEVRDWYNGYLFNRHVADRLYNPDMVLYFASTYILEQRFPETLLDINVASDYSKIRSLLRLDDPNAQNFAVLDTLLAEGEIAAQLTYQFSFERTFTRDDLVSLLFYMGIVTIKAGQLSRLIFEIPNFVINQLYFTYFNELLLQRTALHADEVRIYDRVLQLAQENKIEPLIEAVTSILRRLSNRDAVGFDEKYVKAIFASLLYTTQIYTIHSEYETDRKYVDLLLTRRPPIDPNYQFAFELKYLKQSDAHKLADIKAEGLAQLQGYLQHDDLRVLSDLRAWLIVFVGTEAEVVTEVTGG